MQYTTYHIPNSFGSKRVTQNLIHLNYEWKKKDRNVRGIQPESQLQVLKMERDMGNFGELRVVPQLKTSKEMGTSALKPQGIK